MTLLLSRQAWHDQQVLNFITEQLDTFFADIDAPQQQRLLELCSASSKAQFSLAQRLSNLHQSTEETAILIVAAELEKQAGYRIDPRTAQLHTQQPVISARAASANTAALTSRTLWQAAREGFGFNVAHGTGSGMAFTSNSYLTDATGTPLAGLTVEAFVRIVRSLDLGKQLEIHTRTQVQATLAPLLREHCQAQIDFDVLHGHCLDRQLLTSDELPAFAAMVQDTAKSWASHSLKVDGERLAIPLFIRTVELSSADPVYAYFPARPGGALRRHPSVQSALDAFLNQLIEDAEAGDLGWLFRHLTLTDQHTLATHLNAPAQSLDDFNWLASQLYTAFADQRSAGRRLNILAGDSAPGSLLDALQDIQQARFTSDITRMVATNAAVDRQTLKRGLEYVVSETLEMILLPAPGGLLGAGKLVLVAMLGSLGYQAATAVLAKRDGESAQLVQALADIADLLISARINGVGARLSQRRSRQLMRRMGNPRIAEPDRAARRIEWPTAPDAPLVASYLELGATPSEAMLRKMLPPGSARFADTTLARLLKLAGVSRHRLEAIWNADSATPADLADLLSAEQLRVEFDQLHRALANDQTLPPLANEVLPVLLNRLIDVPVWIQDRPSGHYDGAHGTTQSTRPPTTDLVLVHTGQRRYRTAAMAADEPSTTFMLAAVAEYDRMQPDNSLGKSGDFATDSLAVNRAQWLRQQLAARLRSDEHGLFQQWLRGRLDASPAEPAPLHRAQRRSDTAIATLADPLGRGAHQDASHLAFALMVELPGWPADLGINLYEAAADRNGELRKTSVLLRSYGEPTASRFVQFGLYENRHVGVDQSTGDMIQQRPTAHALLDLALHTLTDPQRDAIAYGLSDAATLSAALVDHALLERSDLHDLFPEPHWLTLSASRLEPFATEFSFIGQAPDAQGLHTHDGRLYAQLGNRTYQVLHDHDASSPHTPVMRIVRAGDAVAEAPDHRYVATRPGRTEPIARDAHGQWQGVVIGLGGGMPLKRQGKRVEPAARLTRRQADHDLGVATDAQLAAEALLAPAERAMQAADKKVEVANRLHLAVNTERTQAALREAVDARTALLPEFQRRNHEFIAALDAKAAVLDAYEMTILGNDIRTRELFAGEYQGVLIRRIATFDQILLGNIMTVAAATQHLSEDPVAHLAQYIEHRRRYLAMLEGNMAPAERREADIQTLRTRFPGNDIGARLDELATKKPVTPYYLKVGRLQFQVELLSAEDGRLANFNLAPTYLARDFRENAVAFKTVDEVVPEQRIALLDGVQREFESIHSAFEAMKDDYPSGPRRARLDYILLITRQFEEHSALRLDQELAAQTTQAPLVRLSDDLDLSFLPPAPGLPKQPAPPRKRIIRIRRRGMTSLAVGEVRIVDGAEQVAVVSHDSGAVVQQYQRNQGQWQRQGAAAQAIDAQVLRARATQRLAEVQGYLDKAEEMSRRKDNPTNIVELCERQADALSDLALQLPEQAAALSAAAARLTDRGRTLMIQRYKDPAVLDVHRVLFLLANHELSVKRRHHRLERGKGKQRNYLDVYEIRDAHDNTELWHAHFHYPEVDSPNDAYPLHGGHLKTLEQSRLGLAHQQRQEQTGQKVERIWRQEIDRNSANRLFAVAHQG